MDDYKITDLINVRKTHTKKSSERATHTHDSFYKRDANNKSEIHGLLQRKSFQIKKYKCSSSRVLLHMASHGSPFNLFKKSIMCPEQLC